MDLAGPKLRTGPMEPGPRVLKYRPKRDTEGRVVSPARIWLTPSTQSESAPVGADAVLPVAGSWLAKLDVGDRIRFTDARGAGRSMVVSGREGESRWAEARRTAYVFQGMILERSGGSEESGESKKARVELIPATEQTLRLKCGDTLVLTKSLEPGKPAESRKKGVARPAQIGVSLAEFFDGVRVGQPI